MPSFFRGRPRLLVVGPGPPAAAATGSVVVRVSSVHAAPFLMATFTHRTDSPVVMQPGGCSYSRHAILTAEKELAASNQGAAEQLLPLEGRASAPLLTGLSNRAQRTAIAGRIVGVIAGASAEDRAQGQGRHRHRRARRLAVLVGGESEVGDVEHDVRDAFEQRQEVHDEARRSSPHA